MDSEVALLDMRIGPDRLHQFIFLDRAPAAADEHQQRLETLLRERYGLAAAQQSPPPLVNENGPNSKKLFD